MKYVFDNLTLNISILDPDYTGDCRFYIPFKHKEFLKNSCGVEKNIRFKNNCYDHIFEHNYGEVYIENGRYVSNSADLLIAYMSWILEQDKNIEVEVEYENVFWAIHDVQHAINDESGCTIYVNAEIEYERLKDAFELFIKDGHELTYKMVEEVAEAYNDRFNKKISFEEYLYSQEE